MEDVPVIKMRRKGRNLEQRMLIPSERMVVDALRAAQAGRLSDLAEVRRVLAVKYGADACCPVTVQQHLIRISQDGSAPFWRVVDPDRPLPDV